MALRPKRRTVIRCEGSNLEQLKGSVLQLRSA